MNHDKSGILMALNDELLVDVPESASALINIVGDYNGQIEVSGSTSLADMAQVWGPRNVSPGYTTNIISNDGSAISAEYRIITGGQSVRLKMISYTSGAAGVRVVATPNASVVEIAPSSPLATEQTLNTISGYFKAEDTAAISGDRGLPMLAQRFAADTPTTDADGDYALLKLDEEGRLKVASKPASYPDITGDITAVQATIGTPVAGGTVAGDVSRASNIMMFCTGTFSTVNCTFEGSLEATGDANWFGVQAVRSNANTIETTTGNLSAQPAYAWEASVNALKRFRVRCTARTSGTQSWRFVQGTYATEPIPAAQISGTQPVSGTVTATLSSPTTYTDTTTNLGISATFTGTSRDAGATPAFYSFVGRAFADQAGTFRIEQSTDNTNWRRATPDTAVAANTPVTLETIVCARYHRVVFINGGVAQTVFQVTSAYHRV